MTKRKISDSAAKRTTAYRRRLFFEPLEMRACPAFSYVGVVGGAHTWEGTNGNDTLNGIYLSGAGLIAFETVMGVPPVSTPIPTGVPAPTAAAPIGIRINGNGGNDIVDFWGGGPGTANMFGFPRGPAPGAPAVSSLKFWGGDGNDTFTPPSASAGPGSSPIISPAAGTFPNIQFFGGNGVDTLNNEADPEYFDGDNGADIVVWGARGVGAGGGNDILRGGPDDDSLEGGIDDDDINGGGGNDILRGNSGNDTLNGAQDDDQIFGGPGNDIINTGPSGAAAIVDPENPPPGGPHWEIVRGDDDDDIISAMQAGGITYLDGGKGRDHISGSPFADDIVGGDDKDTLLGFGGADKIHGDDGEDDIFGGNGGDSLWGDVDKDQVYGEAGVDLIFGGADNDHIYGGTEGDTLNGEAGDDWIEGGAGNDLINGGNDKDILWSNIGPAFDQPWNGNGAGTPGWHDMKGTGPATDGACDLEDNHPECTGGPTPFNDFYTVGHKAVLSIAASGVLGNDLNVPGDYSPLTATLVHLPSQAESFSLNANGSFSYDPWDTFVGTDYFYYRVVQSGVESKSLGIVTISVTNAPPMAVSDSAFTTRNVPVTLNVLSNDGDYDGDDIDISVIVTNPANGTLTTNLETGVITYTPATNYMGSDSFTYKATDGFQESAPVSVNIMVGGMLRLDGNPLPNSSPTTGFALDDVNVLERAAARRWVEAGADEDEVRKRLEGLSIQIQDLPGDVLAAYAPGILVVDINGAGHDWFVDSTPADDSEFPLFTARTERQAVAGTRAHGRVDLLAVLMHETGHFLELDHSDDPHNVMAERLPTGTRRFPSAEDVDLAILNGLGDEIDRDRRRR